MISRYSSPNHQSPSLIVGEATRGTIPPRRPFSRPRLVWSSKIEMGWCLARNFTVRSSMTPHSDECHQTNHKLMSNSGLLATQRPSSERSTLSQCGYKISFTIRNTFSTCPTRTWTSGRWPTCLTISTTRLLWEVQAKTLSQRSSQKLIMCSKRVEPNFLSTRLLTKYLTALSNQIWAWDQRSLLRSRNLYSPTTFIQTVTKSARSFPSTRAIPSIKENRVGSGFCTKKNSSPINKSYERVV